MRVAGRVAAAVAVVSFLAIGLHGRVAKAMEKVTVSVSDDGLVWIRRTDCSLVACALDLNCRCCCCPDLDCCGTRLDLGASGCCQVLLLATVAADLAAGCVVLGQQGIRCCRRGCSSRAGSLQGRPAGLVKGWICWIWPLCAREARGQAWLQGHGAAAQME